MALGKQAKVLSKQQIESLYLSLSLTRDPDRNRLIFLLSVKAGLRAKEIAGLTWGMVIDASGNLADQIALEDLASKGASGRIIPINKLLKQELQLQLETVLIKTKVQDLRNQRIIQTQRGKETSAQVIVNMFKGWYTRAGLIGCSSHSGRRTFITNAAKKISTVGGSLRDVQWLAGHSSLQTTQRYIDGDSDARRKVVDLV
jgi:integrase/recombinase XerD